MFRTYIINPFLAVLRQFGSGSSFCINETFYSYSQLSAKISCIRQSLREVKERGDIIGIITNDDIETYSSIFAVWFEGLAYLPINPAQPSDRNLQIMDLADIKVILDSSPSIVFKNYRTICTSDLILSTADLIPVDADDNSLAYLLFTSGSTGIPKGVPITRGNIGAFMKSFWEVGLVIDHNDRCLQCFDLTFDVSVQSFLVPLTKGACTFTIPHDQIKYSYVYGLLENHKLTFGAMAPSMIRFLRPYFNEILIPSLRYNILTAEASPFDLVIEWSNCIPNAVIYDFYGPTEATIYCTYYKFIRGRNNKQLNGMLSIGKPLLGVDAVIIDNEGNRLGINQKGELCISGNQITPGYWKNPGKNKSSFFELKSEGYLKRFYKTGDLCYIDEDGDIMYSGRLDYQVKIQGHRIELGEIEYHARTSLNGQNAVAEVFESISGNTEIALFVEAELAVSNSLLEVLKQKLPHYMIPSKIISLKEFPLNTNGKIDRIGLKKYIQL